MGSQAAQRAVDAVWRLESARIIAGLARLTGDLGLAEDLAQDALVAALSQWPGSGIPPNPGAWLMSTARHRAIDRLRRDQRLRRNLGQLGHELHTRQQAAVFGGPADFAAKLDALDAGEVQDDLLRLMFVACHPVLSADARVALTLRLLGGLTTDEIARAFLVAEPTIAQRIVRAKRTLARKRVPFEVPSAGPAARPAGLRAGSHLPDLQRGVHGDRGGGLGPAGTLLRGAPARPDAGRAQPGRAGSARPGRPDGDPVVPAAGPGRTRWRAHPAARTGPRPVGPAAHPARLRRAAARERPGRPPGPYVVQAAIAACHAQAATAADTDWPRIAALYQTLAAIAPSPVAELNRAVAVGMAYGPARGLATGRPAGRRPELRRYHLLPSVRGDLLAKLGRDDGRGPSSSGRPRLPATQGSAPCCCAGPPGAADTRRALL